MKHKILLLYMYDHDNASKLQHSPVSLLACRAIGNACRNSPGCHLCVHVYVTISEKTDYRTRSKYLSLKFCVDILCHCC